MSNQRAVAWGMRRGQSACAETALTFVLVLIVSLIDDSGEVRQFIELLVINSPSCIARLLTEATVRRISAKEDERERTRRCKK